MNTMSTWNMRTALSKRPGDLNDMLAERRQKIIGPTLAKLIERMGAKPEGDILEVGAGEGGFNSHVMGLRSIQFDNDVDALRKNPAPDKMKIRGSVFGLASKVGSERFDWVVSYSFLYLFGRGELPRVMGQISKAMKDGGKMLIVNDMAAPMDKLLYELVEKGFVPIPHEYLHKEGERELWNLTPSFYLTRAQDLQEIAAKLGGRGHRYANHVSMLEGLMEMGDDQKMIVELVHQDYQEFHFQAFTKAISRIMAIYAEMGGKSFSTVNTKAWFDSMLTEFAPRAGMKVAASETERMEVDGNLVELSATVLEKSSAQ